MNDSRHAMGAMRIVPWALLTAVVCVPKAAHAESPFGGKWRQGPLHEEYTVQTWISGCGPAPISGDSGGGESVVVHEEGDELVLVGGARTFRTNQCYDPLPTLTREAHTRDPSGRMWRTRCVTPQGDARKATMNTLVTATSDARLELTETGRYEITLAEGRCVADVKRSRAFEAVVVQAPVAVPTPVPAATAATAPMATKADPASGACDAPGEPTRLEARPSRKLLRTGETFQFHAIVRDAAGCVTTTPTAWSIAPAIDNVRRATIDAAGRVTVPDDATEGSVEAIATAAGRSARVTIEVASAARYDELLAQSGLNSAGEADTASVTVLETESIGGRDTPAEDTAHRRRSIFIGVVFAIVSILGSLAILGARRSRKAARIEADLDDEHAERVRMAEAMRRTRADEHAAQVRAHEVSVQQAQLVVDGARKRQLEAAPSPASMAPRGGAEMVCPACHREYPSSSAYCAQDGGKLVPNANRGASAPAGVLCPTCKRGFGAETRYCPFDKDELVPVGMLAPSAPSNALPPRGKICPTCGSRFDGNATFCGKDGTALVLLN